MAARVNSAKQEAELLNLRVEGRALQRTLATVASDYGVYLKKYNDTSERIHVESKTVPEVRAVTVANTDASSDNAIVLVLIDGTSHKFHGELYRNKQAGGAESAKRLRDVVRERVAVMLPALARTEYHIVIKVFACLKSLSSRVAAEYPTHPGPRSLAFHFAEFNKVSPFIDFVDAGDDSRVPTKISENFKLYMASEQCKHVFFGAAGSPKYHSTLELYDGQAEKVTLVTGSIADDKIRTFGLRTVSFPKVFKVGPVYLGSTVTMLKPTFGEPFGLSTSATAMSATSLVGTSPVSRDANTLHLPSTLPTQGRHGRVPINLAKQRLDFQTRLPTPTELQAYKKRTKFQELCVDFHLRGYCVAKECKLSHGASLASEVYFVLQYRALGMPCSRGSGCRSLNCVNAHVCQKEECTRAGGKAALCGLTDAMHKVDLHVAEWVVADDSVLQSSTPVQGNVASGAEAWVDGGVPAPFIEDLISF